MATFSKLPSGNWRVQVRKKGLRKISKTFDKKRPANEWAKKMEGNREHIDAFPDAEARRRTVGGAIDAYMLEYSGRDEGIVSRLVWWKAEYGQVSLASFTQAKIKDALRRLHHERAMRGNGPGQEVRTLPRKKSPATINRYRQAMSSVLTWAVDQSWITANPALGIKRLREPRGRVRWLKEDERKALLNACDKSDWADLGLLVRLALSTGARRGELLNLRWQDLDLKSGLAHIGRSKNDEPRMLPLVEPVRALLEAKARPIKGGLVFPAPRKAKKPYSDCRKHWNTAVQAAGLEDFRFHDLRHSAASYLAMSGASLLEIGDILGHKTLAMVKRYSHLATEHKQELAERVFAGLV